MSGTGESRDFLIGPSRMMLIHCGKFDYAEVELDAPLHLIGPNNVGKTSLIALLQLLYIDDRRRMHFARDMAETRRYYFPEVYSFVLFECLTPTGFQVLGVHGCGPVKQYEFERFAYRGRLDAADFVDQERKPKPHDEIFRKLSDRDFTKLTPGQLRAALTGIGDSRGVDLRLVPAKRANTYLRFRKVFNNILRLSHLKQDELKQLILDIFEGDFQQRSISLADTYSRSFDKVQRDSREVQELKQLQGDIEALLGHIDRRNASRRILPALWQELGRLYAEEKAKLESREAHLQARLEKTQGRSEEVDRLLGDNARELTEISDAVGMVKGDLRRVEAERERFKDFMPDWQEQRRHALRKTIDEMAYRLGRSEQTAPTVLEQRIAGVEQRLARKQSILNGLADALAQRLRGKFADGELEDLFRLLNPALLGLAIGNDDAAVLRLDDEKAAEKSLRTILAGRKGRAMRLPGTRLNLDGVDAPELAQYLDAATIKAEISEMESQLAEYRETLVAARDAEAIRQEKERRQHELENIIRELGEYRAFCELAKQEEAWHASLAKLEERRAAKETVQAELNSERLELVRVIERSREELADIEKKRGVLDAAVHELRQPPAEWEIVPVENLPDNLDDVIARYRRLSSEQASQQERVTEIMERIEARTYSRYTRATEDETVQALREQLESIPEKERAVQELWKGIAVGIKKSLSNIAHDLDILKGRIQSLNRQIGNVEISNLSALRIIVKERRDWVRHIRGIGLDSDMPLFVDHAAVEKSFEELGKLLKEHPQVALDDLFDLQFELATSDEKNKTYPHLESIESNGTTITIKVLVNLVLLRGLLGEADVRIPFYLDECSSLDRDNLKAIVDTSRQLGFTAVLASPDVMDAADRLYFIEEQDDGRVVLDPKATLVSLSRKDGETDG